MPTDTSILALNTGQVPQRHHLDRRAADLAAQVDGADPDSLLTTSEVAEWLGLSTQWVEGGRHYGYGPKFIRLTPRRIRYRRADVLAWLAERTYAATSEYGREPAEVA